MWLIKIHQRRFPDRPHSAIPHALESSSASTICLITADPQRTFKDAIDHPSFPADLRPRITRVIGLSKLKSKYKQYEERRQLFGEHDIFLADDRIVTLLPQILGKTFYSGGSKRPVPVNIAAPRKRDASGKTVKLAPGEKKAPKKDGEGSSGASPADIAKEITKALSSALIHLAPGTSTSVKVAKANMTPEQVAQNIDAVLTGLSEKFIPKGWRNIRSINIKGPNSASYPIWEAGELWLDEEDVLEEKKRMFGNKGTKAIKSTKEAVDAPKGIEEAAKTHAKLKRKAEASDKPAADKHTKKKRKAEVDEKLAAELALRKDRLKKQKAEALAEVGEDVV